MGKSFVLWWYTTEFRKVLAYFKVLLAYIFDFFSVRICLSTLFDVWRRDRISYKGLDLHDIVEAWSLNLASRIIGFFVKITTIGVWFVITLLAIIFAAIFLISWLAFPLIILLLLYIGLKIIGGF